jgi:hypothetical protein
MGPLVWYRFTFIKIPRMKPNQGNYFVLPFLFSMAGSELLYFYKVWKVCITTINKHLFTIAHLYWVLTVYWYCYRVLHILSYLFFLVKNNMLDATLCDGLNVSLWKYIYWAVIRIWIDCILILFLLSKLLTMADKVLSLVLNLSSLCYTVLCCFLHTCFLWSCLLCVSYRSFSSVNPFWLLSFDLGFPHLINDALLYSPGSGFFFSRYFVFL